VFVDHTRDLDAALAELEVVGKVLAWELVAISDRDRKVRIAFDRNDDMRDVEVRVSESDERVVLGVHVQLHLPQGGWFAYRELEEREVTLARPLGRRRLEAEPATWPVT
jgi:hypothetical protein